MNKFFYRAGILNGILCSLAGALGHLLNRLSGGTVHPVPAAADIVYFLAGLAVILITVFSKRRAGLRFYSKLFQIVLFYLVGTVELFHTGEIGSMVLFLLGITIAYRYSLLKPVLLYFTALFNCLLILLYSYSSGSGFFYAADRLMFVLFVYLMIYIVYRDFLSILNRRFGRMAAELGEARKNLPFDEEFRKRMSHTENGGVEFTKKEYEVMAALCLHGKLTNGELSDFMNISDATVKSHLNNIYKKTGIHNRSRLIAVYRGFFTED